MPKEKVGSAVMELKTDAKPMLRGMQKAKGMAKKMSMEISKSMMMFGKTAMMGGKMITMGLTVPIVMAGKAAITTAANFQSMMATIVGLVGVAKPQVDAWSNSILNMAGALGKAPQELADAMFFITSAGLRGSEAMETLNQSARASVGGLGKIKDVADAVTSAINAYGKENITAAQATDVLVATVREGKLQADQLAQSIGKVIPVASQLGISFREIGAYEASLTRIGYRSDTAAIAIRAMMNEILKAPSEDAVAALQAVGMTIDDVRREITEKGLFEALQDMNTAFGGTAEGVGMSIEKLRQVIRDKGLSRGMQQLIDSFGKAGIQMARVFPNIRALGGVLGLLGHNANNTARILKSLRNATGSTDRAFEAMQNTIKQKLNVAMSTFRVALVRLGLAIAPVIVPMIQKLATAVGKVAKWFSNLTPSLQKFVTKIGLVVIAIGPALLILGGLFIALGALVKVFSVVGKSFMILGKIIAGMWPWGIIILAVAAVALIVWKNWDKIKKYTMKLWETLTKIFNGLKNSLVDKVKSMALIIYGKFSDIFERIAKLFIDFGKKIGQAALVIFDPRKWGKGGLKEIFAGGISDAFTAGFQTAGNRLVEEGNKLNTKATLEFVNAANTMSYLISDSWKGVSEAAVKVGEGFKDIFTKGVGGISSMIAKIGDLIDALKKIRTTALGVASSMPATIPAITPPMNYPVTGTRGGRGYEPGAGGRINPTWRPTTTPWAPGARAPIPGGISAMFSGITSQLTGFAATLANNVEQFGALGIIIAMVQQVFSGMMKVLAPIVNVIFDVFGKMLSKIGGIIGKIVMPIIMALVPILDLLFNAFASNAEILLNLLQPVFAGIAVALQILKPLIIAMAVVFEVLTSPVKWLGDLFSWVGQWILVFGKNIGIFIWNLAHPFKQKKFAAGPKAFASDAFSGLAARIKGIIEMGSTPGADTIAAWTPDTTDTTDTTTNTGTGTIQQARPINIKVYIQDNEIVGSDGFRELASILRGEFATMDALGL